MESPLKGQGVPGLNTTQIFLSIRLERLLDLDDVKFRHESVATYWLSWADPGAEAAICERTAAAANETAGCRRPCSNRVADVRCCDSIFLPSLYFYNADAFPEDREIGYSIDTTANGAVVWETTVHAFFYQPLSLRNYPYEAFNAEQQLTLTDTSRLVAGHPGLELVPSGVSVEGVHFARTASDLTNGFSVHPQAALELYRFNRSAWFQGRMIAQPHPADVAPFTALNASTAGLLDDTVQMAVFRFKVWRSYWSGQLNTNYPVLAVAMMAILVFWIPEEELVARIELCAALFLTLIAIQFVVSDRAVSRNDYFTPPQIMILMTGGFILFIACESVVCYYIVKWNTLKQRRRVLWRAAKQHTMQRQAARAAADAALAELGQAGGDVEEGNKLGCSPSLNQSEAGAGAGDIRPGEAPSLRRHARSSWLASRRRTASRMPPNSDEYNAYLAWLVNKVCLVLVLISYCIATVFAMSVHGYGGLLGAPDALLPLSELSSCKVPGVTPGVAGPCPAAPMPASEL